MSKKKLDRMIKEVKHMYGKKNQKSNTGLWIGIGIAVIAALVGLILWIKSKNDEDIEEYYEYFDDELEDELEDDLYGEDDLDDVEYFQIKNFDEDEAEDDEEAPIEG
ncbi:MAG: hypothetical protein ACRCW2_02610 [Cellulosilyticaceae bacterium]